MKTIIVTGTNSGIGKALAIEIIRKGYQLISICRNSDKSIAAQAHFLTYPTQSKPLMFFGDLTVKSDLERIVTEINSRVEKVELLINNAGVFKLEESFNDEGIEMTIAINVIAMFRLTERLRTTFTQMNIINMTSMMFKQGNIHRDILINQGNFNGSKRYSDSKQLVVYYTDWLSQQIPANCSAIAMHPGVVSTDVFRDYRTSFIRIANKFLKKPHTAAKKILDLITTDGLMNGYYYRQNRKKGALKKYVDQSLRDNIIEQLMGTYY